jgi:chromosome segregation ATPase
MGQTNSTFKADLDEIMRHLDIAEAWISDLNRSLTKHRSLQEAVLRDLEKRLEAAKADLAQKPMIPKIVERIQTCKGRLHQVARAIEKLEGHRSTLEVLEVEADRALPDRERLERGLSAFHEEMSALQQDMERWQGDA